MKANELMTSEPFAVTPEESIIRASELMRTINVGSLPVLSSYGDRLLIGIITDRDICTRCVASGHDGHCRIDTHMTKLPLYTVAESADVSEIVRKMEQGQVRRIPVIDKDNRLVGIIAQADLAMRIGPQQPELVEEVVEKLSMPATALA